MMAISSSAIDTNTDAILPLSGLEMIPPIPGAYIRWTHSYNSIHDNDIMGAEGRKLSIRQPGIQDSNDSLKSSIP
jgi:hypothetical protein